nr:hypothetical protein [uncultured Aminipila sp.]
MILWTRIIKGLVKDVDENLKLINDYSIEGLLKAIREFDES